MSKILQAGDTGFGILIEHDAGFVTNETDKGYLNENFELKPNEPVLINCILQKWGVKNKNGRIYPKEVLMQQVNEYQSQIQNNSAVSEADHPDCVYASESMIYTKHGWKNFEDIHENEEILTLNIKTNKIEIQKIDKKIYLPYKGKMYKFSGKNIDLTVTGNHRFLLENRSGKRKYVFAKDIYNNTNNILSSGQYKLLKLGDWDGEHIDYYELKGIDESELGFNKKQLYDYYCESIKIKSEDWFAFIGFYLAEGHCTGNKSEKYKSNGYDVVITQKNIEKKKQFEELFNRLPFKNKWVVKHENGKNQYHISDARLYNYLFPLGYSHTKYIPIELKSKSKKLLNILFDWFMMGDGRNVNSKKHNNWNNKKSVFSTSEKLINDLHEILIKIGGNGNVTTYQPKDRILYNYKIMKKENILSNGEIETINEEIKTPRLIKSKNSKLQYNLNISKSKNIWLDKRSIKIEEIDFNDNIACVRVPNGNFMVKVNGKSHWTGNSSIISLQNISHMITKMWWGTGEKENILYGQLKLIVSPGYINMGIVSVIGDKIVLYLQNKIKLGISSRGVGTLKELNGENLVQDDFELISFDLVATPSTPGAYLFPEQKGETNFGENYVKKNGVYLKENENDRVNQALGRFLI
jgi:hypothetical protein